MTASLTMCSMVLASDTAPTYLPRLLCDGPPERGWPVRPQCEPQPTFRSMCLVAPKCKTQETPPRATQIPDIRSNAHNLPPERPVPSGPCRLN